jgi:hypothetical protein
MVDSSGDVTGLQYWGDAEGDVVEVQGQAVYFELEVQGRDIVVAQHYRWCPEGGVLAEHVEK